MTKPSPRFYRYQHQSKEGWVAFQVQYRETDLWIRAERQLAREAMTAVLSSRHQLQEYIARHPEFVRALRPIADDPWAPPLVRQMLDASRHTGVGPMAAVAGAIAQAVAAALKPLSPSLIVENGGDCYLDVPENLTVGIYAGPTSPFTGKLTLHFAADRSPLSICTSSGTIGHSLSLGKADAVTVVAKDAALADAAATALGNLVQTPADIGKVLKKASSLPALEGVMIMIKDKLGVCGNLELMPR